STSSRRAALSSRLTWVAALLLLVCAGCGKGKQPPPSAPEGHLDEVDGESIAGWAWDRNRPWPPCKVDIYDGQTLLATVEAKTFRQDLLDAGIGSGQHGFVYAIPAELKDGKAHTIRVTISGTDVELTGSPMTVTLKEVRWWCAPGGRRTPGATQEIPYE